MLPRTLVGVAGLVKPGFVAVRRMDILTDIELLSLPKGLVSAVVLISQIGSC